MKKEDEENQLSKQKQEIHSYNCMKCVEYTNGEGCWAKEWRSQEH